MFGYCFLCSLFVSAHGSSVLAEPTESDWVTIEGGCFQMGENTTYAEERPAHETCVNSFSISRTEVTNAQFALFVEQTGYQTRAERGWQAQEASGPGQNLPPTSAVFVLQSTSSASDLSWWQLVEGANWRQPLGPDHSYRPTPDMPVVHVTRADAQAYAAWMGARLPTEAEWEFAARGGLDGTLMAWAESERAALTEKANTWQGVFPVIDTAEDGHRGVAPVASYPANGFGLYDMIGNVWEWTATPFSPSHAENDRRLAGPNGLDFNQPGVPVGTIKGGSYLCSISYCIRFRPAARQAQDLAFGTSHIGFRIVRSTN